MTDTHARANERKQEVLALLEESGPLPTSTVASRLEITSDNARHVLKRLRDQRRVETTRAPPVPGSASSEATHEITDRGREALDHYRG